MIIHSLQRFHFHVLPCCFHSRALKRWSFVACWGPLSPWMFLSPPSCMRKERAGFRPAFSGAGAVHVYYLLYRFVYGNFFFVSHCRCLVVAAVCVPQPCVTGFTSSFYLCHWLHKCLFNIALAFPCLLGATLCRVLLMDENPAPPHHFTLEGSHSNPRPPSLNVGATPLRRRRRILDLRLVLIFSLWWPQC